MLKFIMGWLGGRDTITVNPEGSVTAPEAPVEHTGTNVVIRFRDLYGKRFGRHSTGKNVHLPNLQGSGRWKLRVVDEDGDLIFKDRHLNDRSKVSFDVFGDVVFIFRDEFDNKCSIETRVNGSYLTRIKTIGAGAGRVINVAATPI